jgi:hypothetical protein
LLERDETLGQIEVEISALRTGDLAFYVAVFEIDDRGQLDAWRLGADTERRTLLLGHDGQTFQEWESTGGFLLVSPSGFPLTGGGIALSIHNGILPCEFTIDRHTDRVRDLHLYDLWS